MFHVKHEAEMFHVKQFTTNTPNEERAGHCGRPSLRSPIWTVNYSSSALASVETFEMTT